MTPRPAALLLAVLLAGCGGGTNEIASPSPIPTPTPTVDVAAATAAISATWETFFNPAGTIAAHVALLQDGARFTAELTKSAKDPAAADLSAKVTSVALTGPTAANVTYNLLGKGGVALLTGAQGAAVLEGSTWKVSKLTYCQLVGLQDPTVPHPGCA